MTAAESAVIIWRFGNWPSSHDLDLIVDPPVKVDWPFDNGAGEVVVPPDTLGSLARTLRDVARQVDVPLDVFLSMGHGFVPALWIAPGEPWLGRWRFYGRDFFPISEPARWAGAS